VQELAGGVTVHPLEESWSDATAYEAGAPKRFEAALAGTVTVADCSPATATGAAGRAGGAGALSPAAAVIFETVPLPSLAV